MNRRDTWTLQEINESEGPTELLQEPLGFVLEKGGPRKGFRRRSGPPKQSLTFYSAEIV